MRRPCSQLALFLVAGFTMSELTAQAPPTSQDTPLDLLELMSTPVISASKRVQQLSHSPQAIEVLTGKEIRQMGIYRIQDALKLMTGVDILEQDNGFSVVGMRGVMQQGQPRTVQVLIDGVPLYNAFHASIDIGNLPVPIDVIDRIEIVRGPSSTLYGANAVLGVIAITTKKAWNQLGNARLAKADKGTSRWSTALEMSHGNFGLTAGYEGASLGNSNRPAYDLGNPAWAYTLDAGSGADGYKLHKPDGSHQAAAFARLDWENGQTRLWLSTGKARRNYGQSQNLFYRRYDRNTLLAGWNQTWSGTFTTEARLHQMESIDHFRLPDTDTQSYSQALPLFGRSSVDISGDYKLGGATTRQLELQANWDPDKDLHFVMGADTRKVDFSKAAFLGFPEASSITASGAFVSMDWLFAEGLTLSLGARAENEGLGGSRTSPRANLVWSPNSTSVFRFGYFTSTRSPQMTEQEFNYFYFYKNQSNLQTNFPLYLQATQILPNEQLKPEKSSNFELGYRQSCGIFTLDLTLYRMKISDQITSVITGTPIQTIYIPVSATLTLPEDVPFTDQQFQNKGSATNQGIELALTWVLEKNWRAGMNGRFLKYVQDDLANTAATTTPASWKGEFSYAPKHILTMWTRLGRGDFSGYLAIQHIGAAHAEALQANGVTTYDERPAYFQCDIQFGYEVLKDLTLGVFARNAAREFTLQGATGPERANTYQVQRRELGATLGYRF